MTVRYDYTGGNFISFFGLPPNPFTTAEHVSGYLIFNFGQALQPNTSVSAADAQSSLVAYSFTDGAGDTISSTDSPSPTVSVGPIYVYQDGTFSTNVDVAEKTSATRTVEIQLVGEGGGIGLNGGGPDIRSGNQTVGASTPFGSWALTPTGSGSSAGNAALPIYRFFDTVLGTHLFTQSLTEAQQIISARPDLTQETNNFGAVSSSSPSAEQVYRFFENGNGTHFFTASHAEFLGLTTPGSSSYRSDFTYEASSSFYVDSTQQSGDVAVYRLFDATHGTQFLTGSQTEYQGLTTPGSGTYRSDLTAEGIAFYAPAGTSHT